MLYRNAQLRGLAHNPALPPDLLNRLVAEADEELAYELAHREDLSAEHLRALLGKGHSAVEVLLERGLVDPVAVPVDDPWLALRVAACPGADPAMARVLAGDPEPQLRAKLPEWVRPLPADVVDQLARDPVEYVVEEVVLWQAISPELAEELGSHPSAGIRAAVARNKHTPPSVLVRLSQEVEEDVLAALARNPSTPPAVLADLVRHSSDAIHWGLVGRADLPRWAYAHLAKNARFRDSLAENPAVGESVLRELAAEPSRSVRFRLLHNPAIPLDLLASLAASARIGPTSVPRIDNATDAELRVLAGATTMQVRMLVAARADLPTDLVDLFVDDRDTGVAKAVVTNPAVTAERLWGLATTHGPRVYPRTARNPNCPPELLNHLARNGAGVQKVYREIAKHPNADAETLLLCMNDREARRHVATHPNLPPETVVELLDDPELAEPAAANPALPVRVMAELLGA